MDGGLDVDSSASHYYSLQIFAALRSTTTVLWELKRRIFLPWKAAAKEFAKAGSVKLIKPQQQPAGLGFNLVILVDRG